MSGEENKTVIEMINKLGLSEHEQLLPKSTELLRLLQLKPTGSTINLGAYDKVVICIDLAASLMGVPFEIDIALKLCSIKKSAYANGKRTLQKILDINKVIGINEICVQLGLNQVQKEAFGMLENYRRYAGGAQSEVDFGHPQYATMAIFQACKKLKVKPPKTKLVALSHLKPAQWAMLEKTWENFLTQARQHSAFATASKLNEEEDAHRIATREGIDEAMTDTRTIGVKRTSPEKAEPYENWKKRMLEKAHRELKVLQQAR